jgi:hypothetical protein
MEKIVGMDLQKWMENRGLRPIDQTLTQSATSQCSDNFATLGRD